MYAAIVPILRYVLQALAGWLIAKAGVPAEAGSDFIATITDEVALQVLGAAIFVATTGWYYIERRLKAKAK